jgi:bifunctional UDP-N-acetylglucosamine pyrophosphorylase / glucosamine-1-phosphate N-acetyltransferase
MLEAVLETAESVAPSSIVAVLGAGRDRVAEAIKQHPVVVVVQDPPRGTGDAVRVALDALGNGNGPVLVLSGDAPLLTAATLSSLLARQRKGSLDLAFLSFRPPDPSDFGRVVRDRSGRVRRVVEFKNASARERQLGEVNAGVYCFSGSALGPAVKKLRPNSVNGEYYLTDAVETLAAKPGKVEAVETPDWREAWGINTRRDLAAAEEIERRRILERALDSGVTLLDPLTIHIGPRVKLEPDTVIHPFVSLEGDTVISEGCEILPYTRIVDSTVASYSIIGPHTDVEGARIGKRVRVGPFARIRPETVLEDDVRVGNFVETKKARLGKGTKALHLSYLGDADIGEGANIGAGTITCNYDGQKKHETVIGEGAFIGSDTQLVAPVKVGKGAYVGAGSTITHDVPDGALAVSRTPQKNIEGWARKRMDRRNRT